MTGRKPLAWRLLAGVGAFALAAAGLMGTATAKADPLVGNIDPALKGSIIVHKHVKADGSTNGNPAGAPVAGVTFKVTEVLRNNASIPLATAEGWQAIAGLTPSGVGTAPFSRGTSSSNVTATNGQVTFGNLPVGLYLVEETDSGNNLIAEPAAPFLVTIPYPNADGSGSWVYDVNVYPKNVLQTITPTKSAGDPTAPVLGSSVDWTIGVPVPYSALDYKSFEIKDVLSANLQFEQWVSIAIGGTALVAGDYTVSPDNTTVTLTTAGLAKLNAAQRPSGTTVTAVIRTKVVSIPADGIIRNQATITVNGKPSDTTGPSTNWGELMVKKVSNVGSALLAGAEFDVYATAPDANGVATSLPVAHGVTDANGTVKWTLWVGNDSVVQKNYWLKETKAPAGHVLPANPWTGPHAVNAGTVTEAQVTITNHKPTGPDLPLTGSTGSLAFGIIGLALIAAAGGTLAVRRARASH